MMSKIGLNSLLILLSIIFLKCSSDVDSDTIKGKENTGDAVVNNDVTDENSITASDTVVIVDLKKLKFFMPEEVIVLQQFTSDSVVFFMDYHLVNYFEFQLDVDFITNFSNLNQIFSRFVNDVRKAPIAQKSVDGFPYPDNMKASLSFLQDATPFIINTCVAECSEYALDFDLTNMSKQTDKTIGKLDDEYLELLQMAYEINFSLSNQFKSWFMQTWDYGGGSLLGNKTIYNFLKKCKQFEFKLMKIDPILEGLKQDAVNTALHGVYMLAPVSILEEIKMIVNENLVSSEQATQLNQLANLIKSNATQCTFCFFKELQMNCETGNCNYGG